MSSAASARSFQVLQLPDSSLVNILHFCADDNDPRSLFNAARAHSRLHQVAAMALTSVTWKADNTVRPPEKPHPQQLLDRLVLYLAKHAQHVSSLHVQGYPSLRLPQLPDVQLDQLDLRYLQLQLQACCSTSIKQLDLESCTLLDGPAGLEAALLGLSQLQHLRLARISQPRADYFMSFPGHVLQQWPQPRRDQLTYLELSSSMLRGSSVLKHLALLPSMQDLRLEFSTLSEPNGNISRSASSIVIPANMLSAQKQLTSLRLRFWGNEDERICCPPSVLKGQTALRHLVLNATCSKGVCLPEQEANLLACLLSLTQLTHLSLPGCFPNWHAKTEAFSALTASSVLQHLDIQGCVLPRGVWHQVFPTNKQLPHFRSLICGHSKEEEGYLEEDGVEAVVRCCPGLQRLSCTDAVHYDDPTQVPYLPPGGMLGPLLRLPNLQEYEGEVPVWEVDFEVLKQLTTLRRLRIPCALDEAELLQLTSLRRLTYLFFDAVWCPGRSARYALSSWDGTSTLISWDPKRPDVWVKILLHCNKSARSPEVRRLARAAARQDVLPELRSS